MRHQPLQSHHRLTNRIGMVTAGSMLLAGSIAACGSSSTTGGSSSPSASGGGQSGAVAGAPSWCGPKPVTLGYFDGNGANAWSQESLAQAKIAVKKCPSIKKMMVVDAGLNLQKATTGLDSLVARGANAIVMVPDLGPAELPGIKSATQHGVKVVPWAVSPGGSAPADYVAFLNYDTVHNGQLWGEWLGKALHGKGNVVYLGGPPANPIDVDQLTGLIKGLKKYPGIKLLTGTSTKTWPVTNWDPSTTQKVMAGLISKYAGTRINAIVTGDGQSTLGALTAFKDANVPLPDVAGQESNGLACAWKDAKGTPGAFQLATSSNRNWMAQVAVQKAVAAVNGKTTSAPDTFELPLYENSIEGGSLTPHCVRSQPMSSLTSSILKPLSFWLSTQ